MELINHHYQDPPHTLYHYTSLEALVSIVRSKRLRASSIRFLNDTSELQRFTKDVVAILHQRIPSLGNVSEINDLIVQTKSLLKHSFFVASFSEKSDLLSQWRAYCPSGLGVSIGFKSSCLNGDWIWNPNDDKHPFLMDFELRPVRYHDQQNRAQAESEVDSLIELTRKEGMFEAVARILPPIRADLQKEVFPDGLAKDLERRFERQLKQFHGLRAEEAEILPLRSVAAWVGLLAPFIKHEAFEEEREWRIVVTNGHQRMMGQQFRMGKSTLIPFVECLLDLEFDGGKVIARDEYFISEVVVGPTPTPKLTVEALKSLFWSEGQKDVSIRTSVVPFRSW